MSSLISASRYCDSVFDGTHDTPKPATHGKLLITSKHIAGGTLDVSSAYLISEQDYDSIQSRSAVSQWDILFSMIGSVGETYLEKDDSVSYAIKNMGVFSCKNEYKAKWLYYYLQSPAAKSHINRYLNGAVQKFLPLGALRNFPVIPFSDDKINLVKVLESLDAKIHLNNGINAELEALAKTIYDYWFVQFDFPDANGKPYKSSGGKMVYNATLKREIPEGWADKKLCQIANITMGTSPSAGSFNDSGDGVEFFQGSTDFGWQFPTVRQYTTQPERMARRGDILLSVRAPVGDMNIAHIDCCIGRGLAALNSKNGFGGFLFYVMKYFKTTFDRRNGEGTTFGSITKDDLFSLPLACPSADLLKRYDEIVSKYNQAIYIRSIENQQLCQLRDWLLPMLMNGQVTVADT